MMVKTVQVYRKSDGKRLGYLYFSKTRGGLMFAIKTPSQELRWNAMETLQAAISELCDIELCEVVEEGKGKRLMCYPQHRAMFHEDDKYYLTRIAKSLPQLKIPEYLDSIRDYGNPQPDRIFGEYKEVEVKDTVIDVIKDRLETNNYDYKQLVGKKAVFRYSIKCPHCAMSHDKDLEVFVERVEGKKAYGGSGSAYVSCSDYYGGGEYQVIWNSSDLAIVQKETIRRREPEW